MKRKLRLDIEKIRAEMQKQGITRYRLAKIAGLTNPVVYALLKAGGPRESHTFRTVNRLAQALSMDPKDLVTS